MQLVVDIADMQVSDQREDIIITYSLGSCVGISIYDPVKCVGGMIHCMLPLSKLDKAKSANRPCMFVDTGLPKLLKSIYDLGGQRSNLVVKVAGGGKPLVNADSFKIGERNFIVTKKFFWKNDMLISDTDVGGSNPRTMVLELSTGRTLIRSRGKESEL